MHLPPPPPAHVSTVDESDLRGMQLRSAQLDPEVRALASSLSQLLKLPSIQEVQEEVLLHAARYKDDQSAYGASRNEERLDGHIHTGALGVFSFRNERLTFTLTESAPADKVLAQIVGLRGAASLSPDMVRSLLQENTTLPENIQNTLLVLLTRLERSESIDTKVPPLPVIESRTTFIVPNKLAPEIPLMVTTHALDLVRALSTISAENSIRGAHIREALPQSTLTEKQKLLEVSQLFNQVTSLSHHSNLRARNTAQDLLGEVRTPIPPSFEAAIAYFSQHAELRVVINATQTTESIQVSPSDAVELIKRTTESEHSLAKTYRDVFIGRAYLSSASGETISAVSELRAASYFDRILQERGSPEVSLRDSIVANAYSTAALAFIRKGEPPTPTQIDRLTEELTEILPPGVPQLAALDGLTALRNSFLLQSEYDGTVRRSIATLTSQIDSLSDAAVRHSGVSPNGETTPAAIATPSARMFALEATLAHTVSLFEQRKLDDVGRFDRALAKIISSETDEAASLVLQARAIATLAPYIIEGSKFRSVLTATISSSTLRLSDTRNPEEIALAVHTYLKNTGAMIDPLESGGFLEQQFVEVTRGLCAATAYTSITSAILHTQNPSAQEDLFRALQRDHASIVESEHAQLVSLIKERSELQKLLTTDGALLPRQAATGKLQALDLVIARLSRSICASSIELATVALQSRNPKLLKEARHIIEAIPEEALHNDSAAKIVAHFLSQHQSDTQLLAALKAFLDQAVKDKPLHTLPLMIAGGLLGAGLASLYTFRAGKGDRTASAVLFKRRLGQGFLGGSLVSFGLVKFDCLKDVLSLISEAYAFQLTYSTPLHFSLDTLFFFTDAAQAFLIIDALRHLRKRTEKPQANTEVRLINEIQREFAAFGKLLLAQCKLTSYTPYLLGVPLGVGIYQILQAPLRTEAQFSELLALFGEAAPVLLIALLHDRIVLRLNEERKESAVVPKDDSEDVENPPLPNLAPDSTEGESL